MAEHRFYQHFESDPFFNMAADEWLLNEAIACPGSLFVRLYSWKPGAITFGFNQNQRTALDFEAVADTPVIRRVTGGRAIYHDPSELTYAIALNLRGLEHTRLTGSLSQVSGAIATFLADFLTSLGVESQYVRRSGRDDHRPEFFHKAPCFASTSKYELVSHGRKVVASAQKRVHSALLQHGSIKIAGVAPHPALGSKTVPNAVQLSKLESHAFGEFAELFRKVVSVRTGVELLPSELSASEIEALNSASHALAKDPLSRREIVKRIQPATSL